MRLIDSYERQIDYLRISVTDHCNLMCGYCMPSFSIQQHAKKSEILSFEEIHQLSMAAVAAGIKKIRITGGEPLIRKGIVELCRMLAGIDGLKELSLTTNGVLLKQFAEPLFHAGLQRVNISLDTLNRKKFKIITGQDHLFSVLTGIREAEKVGLSPIKINTVVMQGINDDEISQLANITMRKPYQVRFIELMPFDKEKPFSFKQRFMPIQQIIKKIPNIDGSHIIFPQKRSGPAKLCVLAGAKGSIGFIAPVSWHFCKTCNRLRLTATGNLKTCLFAQEELDLKSALRKGASHNELITLFQTTVIKKPQEHQRITPDATPTQDQGMYTIGG